MKSEEEVGLTVVLMAGLPGTGKSKLAYELSKMLDWVVMDKDLIHSAMIEKGIKKNDSGAAAYEVAFWLVKDLLKRQKKSVILDTAGRQPFILERMKNITSQEQAKLKIIRCVASKDVRVKRLSERSPLASQWALDNATETEQEVWYEHLPAETLVIQTDGSFESYFDEVLRYLKDEGLPNV